MPRHRAISAVRASPFSPRVPQPSRDPDAIAPAQRQDYLPVALASVIIAFLAFLVCASRGWLLLYGDAVAHLGIARRILDARYPGIAQLGGVWLPLPHLLMLPFVWRMDWWQSGVAGAFPSLAMYILANLGLFRLARHLLAPPWAFVATVFFALNPNLLYLSTTAMTEPLFLAEMLWSVVFTLEAVHALRAAKLRVASVRMIATGLLTLAMVLTRYDGWILGVALWLVLAAAWFRSEPATRRKTQVAVISMTVIMMSGPLLWFAYNAKYQGDWLDFLRGPYSAAAIERRTTPPSAGRYHGWHNPLYAFLYYTRTAQIDAAAWETGFLLFAGAVAGSWLLWRTRIHRAALLLWVPLPFYLYSIAYSSVPIFIPQLYPHAYYNSRYGMELLPTLVLFSVFAIAALARHLKATSPNLAGALQPLTLFLVVANTVAMIYFKPLVFAEAEVNSQTRIPFEKELARELNRVPPGAVIMISTIDHIGAVQDAGIPLRQLISPLDSQRFDPAKAAPARHANVVIAMDNDPVEQAVKAHPEGLAEIEILCHTGQGCARIYRSDRYAGASQ